MKKLEEVRKEEEAASEKSQRVSAANGTWELDLDPPFLKLLQPFPRLLEETFLSRLSLAELVMFLISQPSLHVPTLSSSGRPLVLLMKPAVIFGTGLPRTHTDTVISPILLTRHPSLTRLERIMMIHSGFRCFEI